MQEHTPSSSPASAGRKHAGSAPRSAADSAAASGLAREIRDKATELLSRLGPVDLPGAGPGQPGLGTPGIFQVSGTTFERSTNTTSITPTGQPAALFVFPSTAEAQAAAALADLPGAQLEVTANPVASNLLFSFVPGQQLNGTTYQQPDFRTGDTALATVTFAHSAGNGSAVLSNATVTAALVRTLCAGDVAKARLTLVENTVSGRYDLRFNLL